MKNFVPDEKIIINGIVNYNLTKKLLDNGYNRDSSKDNLIKSDYRGSALRRICKVVNNIEEAKKEMLFLAELGGLAGFDRNSEEMEEEMEVIQDDIEI